MDIDILIYGANGYTGQLIAKQARLENLRVHLASRNKSAIAAIAEETGFSFSCVSLNEHKLLVELLKKFKCVIHCAGPFTETAKQMVEACLAAKTDYIDITGEIWAFKEVMAYHETAVKSGIRLISGAGFDVVPTDCMAAHLKDKLPDAETIEMSFVGSKTKMSRGTAVTMAKNISKGGFIRENGELKNVPLAYKIKELEFLHKKQLVMSIPWGDLMTTYYQTNIPNIIIYSGVSRKLASKIKRFRFLKFILGIGWIQKIVRKKIENETSGPDEHALQEGKTYLNGIATNKKGESRSVKMITPEAYKLTALTALASAKKLIDLTEKIPHGYLTPAQAFGKDFIMQFEGVECYDVDT